MADEESVKVAVRIRPFNSREKERNAVCCIKMYGNTTEISDPSDPAKPPKKFTFDYSYWSHDGFEEKDDGLLVPEDERYADQARVFNDLGKGVLANAFEGFNTSLFAYGQTGSGKSYSMVGYGQNKGIVPITCDELFKRIESAREDTSVRFQVSFSMLEIYNEQVRDLLSKQVAKGGLPVRQAASGKFFVQGLKMVPVGSYREIELRMQEGTSNRTVAATKMNATSSRAHTVVTIMFDQIRKNDAGQETKKSSEINLVDLAGSERASSTEATGDRLKEGSAINKSLSCLGNVISALAELSNGKKKVLVPYRDSVLTKLLANSLGGNSKTIMIAALSPADINYEETLSTLRYADRAKQIKNKAVVNESATDKLIRTLKEENERLRKLLDGTEEPMARETSSLGTDDMDALRKQMEEEIRAQLEANMNAMRMDESSWEQARQEAQREEEGELKAAEEQERKRKAVPHFVNLNEDPMLSFVVFHFLEKPKMVIGKADSSNEPDIPLSGLSIRNEHALVQIKSKKKILLKPGNTVAKTKVNGMPLTSETQLKHMDRVLFGSNHLYLFINPPDETKSPGTPDHVDWEFAQNEIAKAKGFQTGAGGLSKDQLRTQEQVLELLPLLSEANAVSEELNKQRSFEVVLISGAHSGGGKDTATTVAVRMKNLLNGNEWLWSRGKFFDKRFQFQSMYQEWVEAEDPDSKLYGLPEGPDDPFFEPLEDVLVGTSNLFLQGLAYGLDLEDTLDVVDYKGEHQGRVAVHVQPCNREGTPLQEDDFVEDPSEWLGKPYYFKVLIDWVEVNKTRYSKSLYVEYTVRGEETTRTNKEFATTNPTFQHATVFGYPKLSPDTLEWFENGCLNIRVMAGQEDTIADARLASMTTRQIRNLDQEGGSPTKGVRAASMQIQADSAGEDATRLKSKCEQLQRLNDRLMRRESRIQEILDEYAKMPASEQTFEGLHRAVSAALSSRKKFKSAAHLLRLTARAAKQLSRTDLKAAGSAPQSPSLPARAGHAVGPARASSTEQTNKSAACVLQ
eukprot:m.112316 g.112316  ORF g.112316 m.112316 type:complete len:1027 (-) comp9395_c0_seq1:200-3280(-)